MKLTKKDLILLQKLTKENVEYGGTLKRYGKRWKIDKLVKGTRNGINLPKRKNTPLFHTHSFVTEQQECSNNFPSLWDVQEIIDDKINFGIPFHLIVTHDKLFWIESGRNNFLNVTNKLIDQFEKVCLRKQSIKFLEKIDVKINEQTTSLQGI